jgi:hypothetical protein
MADAEIAFDPDTLELTIRADRAVPRVAIVNGIRIDILGATTDATRVAGPLANLAGRSSWHVDPRHPG